MKELMYDTKVQNILEILAMAIFVDNRVMESEITAFVNAVKTLEIPEIQDKGLSEVRLILWHEMNEDKLQTIIKNQQLENWFAAVRQTLTELPNPEAIFDALGNIA